MLLIIFQASSGGNVGGAPVNEIAVNTYVEARFQVRIFFHFEGISSDKYYLTSILLKAGESIFS